MSYKALLTLLVEEATDDFLDEDDDESFLFQLEPSTKRNSISRYWESVVPQYTEKEFMEHFRITRSTFNFLLKKFVSHPIYETLSDRALAADKHLGIFLWFAAHEACCYRDVKDRFDISIGSVHNVILRVTYFISSLSEEFIRWPTEPEKVITAEYFQRKTHFPNVIGAIDGTHFKFDPPKDKKFDYINRKKDTTIQGQAICDHNRKFIDLFVGYPGKCHDARIYKNSDFYQNIDSLCNGYYILGDSAYPCSSHVITPYKDYGKITDEKRYFNFVHSSTRMVIEHSFGILKQRFRQLYHCKLKSFDLLLHFIRACVVLHNICIDCNDIFEMQAIAAEEQDSDMYEKDSRSGVQIRDEICNLLWQQKK